MEDLKKLLNSREITNEAKNSAFLHLVKEIDKYDSSIEFIYKLTKTDKVVGRYLDIIKGNESKYVPEGWSNHPTGISLEMGS